MVWYGAAVNVTFQKTKKKEESQKKKQSLLSCYSHRFKVKSSNIFKADVKKATLFCVEAILKMVI